MSFFVILCGSGSHLVPPGVGDQNQIALGVDGIMGHSALFSILQHKEKDVK